MGQGNIATWPVAGSKPFQGLPGTGIDQRKDLLTTGREKIIFFFFLSGKCHLHSEFEAFWVCQPRVTGHCHQSLSAQSHYLVSPLTPLVDLLQDLHLTSPRPNKCVLALRLSHSRGSLGRQPSHLKIHFHPAASATLECNLGPGKHSFTCFN